MQYAKKWIFSDQISEISDRDGEDAKIQRWRLGRILVRILIHWVIDTIEKVEQNKIDIMNTNDHSLKENMAVI